MDSFPCPVFDPITGTSSRSPRGDLPAVVSFAPTINLSFQADKLLSDLGGTLAVFIGFSAITLLECGELMLDFLALGLIKMYNVANRRVAAAGRRASKAKVEPFVTRGSCGEAPADTVPINQDISNSSAIPCQMQDLEY